MEHMGYTQSLDSNGICFEELLPTPTRQVKVLRTSCLSLSSEVYASMNIDDRNNSSSLVEGLEENTEGDWRNLANLTSANDDHAVYELWMELVFLMDNCSSSLWIQSIRRAHFLSEKYQYYWSSARMIALGKSIGKLSKLSNQAQQLSMKISRRE